MAIDYSVPGTTVGGGGPVAQINTLGPNGVTTTQLPGSSPTSVGSITQSTGSGDQSSNSHQQNTSGGTSYIPDYEPQLGFLQQYGNMAGNLANQQYDWASNQFLNNSDLTNQNVNNYLEQSDLASTGAQRDFANYNDMFNPAAGSLTADWQSYASPDRIAAEMGSAEAGAEHSFEAQRKNAERDLQSYGLNPGDPRYQGATQASRTAQAAAQAGAGNQARINTENTARNLRTQAIQVASQLPGQTATEQNVALQGYTGGQNAALANTSLGALTMGTAPQYLTAGGANNKFQPLGNVQSSQGTNDSTGSNVTRNQSTSGPVLNTTPYSGFHYMAEGGAIPDGQGGGHVSMSMSPSGGAQTDDVAARIQQTGQEARLNVDEFVIPQDVSRYLGQKFLQDLIKKSRTAMGDPNQSPAQATTGPGGAEHHAMGGGTGSFFDSGAGTYAMNTNFTAAPPGQFAGSISDPNAMGGGGGSSPNGAMNTGNRRSTTYNGPAPNYNAATNQYTGTLTPSEQEYNTAMGGGGAPQVSQPAPAAPQTAGRPQVNPGAPAPAPAPAPAAPAPQVNPNAVGGPSAYHAPAASAANNYSGIINPNGIQNHAAGGSILDQMMAANAAGGPTATSTPGLGGQAAPTPQVSLPAPSMMQHTSGSEPGAIPTMSAYRAANPMAGIMSNGGGSSQNGKYGYGISGGPGTPAASPSQVFKPRSSYYTPRVPAAPMKRPGWTDVTAQSAVAPPTTVPGGGTPGSPGPSAPSGPGVPGNIGHGSVNNDGHLHPMLPDDLEQLLTSGDKIAQQNAALYARHGIPMPEGVTFGNPKDPTSFAYNGMAS